MVIVDFIWRERWISQLANDQLQFELLTTVFSFFLWSVIWELHAGARLITFNTTTTNNKYTYKLSPYITPTSSWYFCDTPGLKKAEGEAPSRVQFTLYRPLSVIFEKVVAKLGASWLNDNKRQRDIFKFLTTRIFARHALFCNRFLRQMCTPKT